jgi:hypothetical protein
MEPSMELTVTDIIVQAFPVLAMVLAIVLVPLLSDGGPRAVDINASDVADYHSPLPERTRLRPITVPAIRYNRGESRGHSGRL